MFSTCDDKHYLDASLDKVSSRRVVVDQVCHKFESFHRKRDTLRGIGGIKGNVESAVEVKCDVRVGVEAEWSVKYSNRTQPSQKKKGSR